MPTEFAHHETKLNFFVQRHCRIIQITSEQENAVLLTTVSKPFCVRCRTDSSDIIDVRYNVRRKQYLSTFQTSPQ
jgi:hypothetical protein